ncbi:MAG: hypothetical protein IMZ70_05260 [Candidatus Atribacteria bacterium]|nr:hypothetical protein [Candidatus Atribacteria bacterium]MBE3127081.1 hypothetical protein [Candidatus Atribacteria bacterium]
MKKELHLLILKCPPKLISEEDLKKSQQEFASLFRNSPEALVTELFLLLFCLLVVVLDIVA